MEGLPKIIGQSDRERLYGEFGRNGGEETDYDPPISDREWLYGEFGRNGGEETDYDLPISDRERLYGD